MTKIFDVFPVGNGDTGTITGGVLDSSRPHTGKNDPRCVHFAHLGGTVSLGGSSTLLKSS